jgi:predicted dehydrogenase/threonine dehydrogenase-like Zn-dependent dehydrogenase
LKQIVQSVSNGELKLVEVPQPAPGPTEVLVATRRSLLSAGTEKAVRQLASANLLEKARARPDLVKQVIKRARTEGLKSTLDAVRTRLDEDMPLGYSAAGVAVTVGEAVAGVRPGMRVATASAGHAEYQLVPGLLTVPLPEEVSDEAAAFGAVAAIALQGLRQAEVGVGGSICVIGLGLVGQLTVRLGLAAGLDVIGIDLRDWTADLATAAGAVGLVEAGADTTEAIRTLTRGRGVDAVLLTAATQSSAPVQRATELLRDRGRLVVVGDVGLELDRRPFYEGEIDIRFARSYGPGRYDRSYEEWGVDYPIGHVRWTEGRNIEAYLDLVKRGRLQVDDLITHVFPFDSAAKAYATLESDASALAVQLSYDAPAAITPAAAPLTPRRTASGLAAGIIGAGNYARATFLPALKAAGWGDDLRAVASSGGLSAGGLAERHNIDRVLPTADALINDDQLDVVFILSRHDSHADMVVKALDAGKHVFVEKPLALTDDDLEAVEDAYRRNSGHLFVGFNRRYSDAVVRAQAVLGKSSGPLAIDYRINAGRLPEAHWYKDRRQGGRLLGEVCHFIDLANWIVGSQPTRVHTVGAHTGESALTEDVAVLLGYDDGSTATVTYTTGAHASTAKERLEILGRGHTVLIDDFRELRVDGKQIKDFQAGKGHVAGLKRFRAQLTGSDSEDDIRMSIGATATTLDALTSLAAHGENAQ